VQSISGVRNYRYGKVFGGAEGSAARYYLVSDAYFDDVAALKAALRHRRWQRRLLRTQVATAA
jgi:hypothetical protein